MKNVASASACNERRWHERQSDVADPVPRDQAEADHSKQNANTHKHRQLRDAKIMQDQPYRTANENGYEQRWNVSDEYHPESTGISEAFELTVNQGPDSNVPAEKSECSGSRTYSESHPNT